MGESKVSVIVPIYNCEKYLEACLDSIACQDYSDIEILLIDDGSKDNSPEICRDFEARDPRFRYVRKDNGGVSSARNLGIDLASGDYLAFVDGDDLVLKDFISTLVNTIEVSGTSCAVISPIIRIDGKDVPYNDSDVIHSFSGEDAVKEALLGVKFGGHLWNKLFKRELFQGIRLKEDLAICEDLVAVCEIFLKCDRIAFADLHKYIYFTNSSSAINSSFKESFLTYITAAEYLVSMTERELPSAVPYAKCALINAHIDVVAKLYYSGRLTREEHSKYRKSLKNIAERDVFRLMPIYKRYLARAIMGSRMRYVITVRAFNLLKKIIYLIRNR